MSIIKGKLEVTLSLSRSSCYFLKTGKCSLNVVTDYYVSPDVKTAPSDLLYCPRLYRAMCHKEKDRPLAIIPCSCGHAEVASGAQRACIAAQKGLTLSLKAEGEVRDTCKVCGTDQLTWEENSGGNRIVTILARVETDD